MSTPYKHLYRVQAGRMIGGVCAGLGEYFSIDPTLVRLGFVFGGLLGAGGAVLLAYLILLIVVPEAPLAVEPKAETTSDV